MLKSVCYVIVGMRPARSLLLCLFCLDVAECVIYTEVLTKCPRRTGVKSFSGAITGAIDDGSACINLCNTVSYPVFNLLAITIISWR